MNPKIELNEKKILAGSRLTMSLADNKTALLWQGFMTERSNVQNVVGIELYAVEVYPDLNYFTQFNPLNKFEKWAAVQVSECPQVLPEGMECLIIPEGLYAVFTYKGKSSEAGKFYQHLFSQWLPGSDYKLDLRPHFAVMDEKYRNDHPDSEEQIWIPVIKE